MKIYLLYTGGTIGCVGTPLDPMPGPQFKAAFQAYVEGIITTQIPGSTIYYDWFDPTLDSTNMQPSDWVSIAKTIVGNYAAFDCFLILHGTDTMAFTASANTQRNCFPVIRRGEYSGLPTNAGFAEAV